MGGICVLHRTCRVAMRSAAYFPRRPRTRMSKPAFAVACVIVLKRRKPSSAAARCERGPTMGLFSFSASGRKKRGAYGGSGYYGNAGMGGFGGMLGMFGGSLSSSARRRAAYQQQMAQQVAAQQAPLATPIAPVQPNVAPPAAAPAQQAVGMSCPHCGAQVPAGSKFCLECGQKIGGGFCAGCGATLPPDAKFCPSCGTPRA